ncbi:replication factor RFC1 C terminal domain-containing protein [Pilobolus umbonatus]|nr:replication factor RFC1 C terminal domain-containing protein [Pilobolus umbonatus]
MGIEQFFKPGKRIESSTSKKKEKEPPVEDDDFQSTVPKKKKPTESVQIDPKDFFNKGKKPQTDQKTAQEKKKESKRLQQLRDEEARKAKREEKEKREQTKNSAEWKAELERRAIERQRVVEREAALKEEALRKIREKEEARKKEALLARQAAAARKKEALAKKIEEANKSEEKVEEKEEPKKKGFYALMNKAPPQALGTRPPPAGAPNCLAGLAFVISGQYETLTKEQTMDIIKRYGGRVTGQVSGKTDYLLRGRDSGETKTQKAKALKKKILDENEFYELVESRAEKPEEVAPPKKKGKTTQAEEEAAREGTSETQEPEGPKEIATTLWAEKYRPTNIKDIVGNRTLIQTIYGWLESWEENKSVRGQRIPTDINTYGAILISGPPGIGKSTTANVVATSLGYEPVEFNASDVRSKKILKESISEMMDNHTMTEFFQSKTKIEPEARLLTKKKVVLIMDEVDGMSSGDRGGSAELAALIRKTKIPVICICNDLQSAKVAPLLTVCFSAKFIRTPANQIRSRMMTIAHKEKLKISANAVDELVAATRNDIRQVINIMSIYRLKENQMDYDQAKQSGKNAEKPSNLGLFDIPLELISSSKARSRTFAERADIYFNDPSLAPLMIFENYIKSVPDKSSRMLTEGNIKMAGCLEMDLFAKAAESMATADIIDRSIHGSEQNYSLYPVHSIFSCVAPAAYVQGGIRSQLGFPAWLGENSKAGKNFRARADISMRLNPTIPINDTEITTTLVYVLAAKLSYYLLKEDYDEAIKFMEHYDLNRRHLEVLSDLMILRPEDRNPISDIPTKIKTKFTRLYNQANPSAPLAIPSSTLKRTIEEIDDGEMVMEEVEVQESEDDDDKDDITTDKMITTASNKRKKPASTSRRVKQKK